MSSFDVFAEMNSNQSKRVTQLVDILNDYNFGETLTRNDFKVTDDNGGISFPLDEKSYTGEEITYDTNTQTFTYHIPYRNYEYEQIGIKAIKTIDSGSYSSAYKYFFTFCNLAPNSTKCIGFYNSNLNNGIEYMNLNQNLKIEFWFNLPFNSKRYNISTLSKYFDHFIIEFDLIRK